MGGRGPKGKLALAVKRRPHRRRVAAGSENGSASLSEQTAVIRIADIAAGGDGVGRADGLAVFVPRTAVGDAVRVSFSLRGRLGRGRVLELLERSPDRVEARCQHYDDDSCGGCQLQHLNVEAQQRARCGIVQQTLWRIGRRQIGLPSIVSGENWNYRSRITLTLKRAGGKWIGGLHRHDRPDEIFDLRQCDISHPLLIAVWNEVRAMLERRAVRLPESESLRLSLRLDAQAPSEQRSSQFEAQLIGAEPAAARVAMVLTGGSVWAESKRWMQLLAGIPGVSSFWWEAVDGSRNSLASEPAAGLMGPASEGEDGVEPDPRDVLAFSQVNTGVATALRTHVGDCVARFEPHRVLDAYAGSGALTGLLVERGYPVAAVESDPEGARQIERRLVLCGNRASTESVVLCALMESAIAEIEQLEPRIDAVVVNPPRGGLDARVSAMIERMSRREVKGVVYVSCDPATLARDLARMPSWQLASVRCFDMFPQTSHVETVCVLQRSEALEAA